MLPEFITFTGIDEKTDLARVAELSAVYPCEWGLLFSENRQGIQNRYPHLDIVDRAKDAGVRLAAHVCGKYARDIMDGKPDKKLPLKGFTRVQVNHIDPREEALMKFAKGIGFDPESIIAQTRTVHPSGSAVSWLYDPSGGKGLETTHWPKNDSDAVVGYAGGINHKNVAAINEQIDSPSGYWLDMESGVRTDDWLDLGKVEAVLRAIYGTR